MNEQNEMTHGEIVNAINDSPINPMPYGTATLAAEIEDDGLIRIEIVTDNHVVDPVDEIIEHGIVGLPLEWVRSDESANVAWYKVAC